MARVWLWGTSSITVKCKPSPLTQPKPTPKTRCFAEIELTTSRAPLRLSRKKIQIPNQPLDPTNVSSASESSHDVRVVEFDFTMDGVDDAIVFSRGNWNGSEWPLISAVQFQENNGGGRTSRRHRQLPFRLPNRFHATYQPIIADYDFDGRRDIFISGPSFEGDHQSTSILFQNENGQFTDTGRSILSASVADMGSMAAAAMGPDNQWLIHSSVRWRTGRFRNIKGFICPSPEHRTRSAWQRGKPDRFGCRELMFSLLTLALTPSAAALVTI